MFILLLWTEVKDKHCRYHNDRDYDCDCDKEIRYNAPPLASESGRIKNEKNTSLCSIVSNCYLGSSIGFLTSFYRLVQKFVINFIGFLEYRKTKKILLRLPNL